MAPNGNMLPKDEIEKRVEMLKRDRPMAEVCSNVRRHRWKQRIVWALRAAGERGMSRRELHVVTGIPRWSLDKLVTELRHEKTITRSRYGIWVLRDDGDPEKRQGTA